MNIHEYQAKEIFRKFNIDVPQGYEANSLSQIKDVTTNIQKITGVIRTETMVQVK